MSINKYLVLFLASVIFSGSVNAKASAEALVKKLNTKQLNAVHDIALDSNVMCEKRLATETFLATHNNAEILCEDKNNEFVVIQHKTNMWMVNNDGLFTQVTAETVIS
jgi:hypothetical protein